MIPVLILDMNKKADSYTWIRIDKPPSHLYVLLNRTVLCNCVIEAENNFLLESIAACDPDSTDVDWRCILWPIQHF